MLKGTIYADREDAILDPTDENLKRTARENYAEEKYWGRIMQVRDEANRDIETPGLVVLEIDEELYDIESQSMFPGFIYWIVTDKEIYEAPDFVAANLRLGGIRGIIEADIFLTATDGGESVSMSETLDPLDKLIAFGGLKNAEKTRERAELHDMELGVLAETIQAESL